MYCTALRNMCCMNMAARGDVFPVDQWPNCNFGNTAMTYDDDEKEASLAYNRFKPTNGSAMVQPGCSKFP